MLHIKCEDAKKTMRHLSVLTVQKYGKKNEIKNCTHEVKSNTGHKGSLSFTHQVDAPVPSFAPTAVDHSAVVALQVSASSACLTPSEVVVVYVDHYAVLALCQFHLHLCCFPYYYS